MEKSKIKFVVKETTFCMTNNDNPEVVVEFTESPGREEFPTFTASNGFKILNWKYGGWSTMGERSNISVATAPDTTSIRLSVLPRLLQAVREFNNRKDEPAPEKPADGRLKEFCAELKKLSEKYAG